MFYDFSFGYPENPKIYFAGLQILERNSEGQGDQSFLEENGKEARKRGMPSREAS